MADRLRSLAACLAAASVLAACAALDRLAPTAATGETVRAAPAPAAPHPAPAPAPANDDPGQLTDMALDDVATLLGDPTTVRHDGDTQIWLYRADGGCVLHLFVYRRDGAARVAHFEARRALDLLDTPATRRCMRALLAGRPAA